MARLKLGIGMDSLKAPKAAAADADDQASPKFALDQKVEVSSTPQQRFKEYLQSRGMRITKQKRLILDEVYRQHDHFDADELLKQLSERNDSKKASRATVYRFLQEMVEAGLLRKMSLGGRQVYEHDYGYPQHDHLYCRKCQKLIEFSNAEIKQFSETVARANHFRPDSHRLIIYGVCQECSKPRRRPRQLDSI